MDLLRKTLAIGVVFIVVAVAGCTKKAGTTSTSGASASGAGGVAVEDPPTIGVGANYEAIGQRNMFRPLVHTARGGEGAAGEGTAAGQGAGGAPGQGSSGPPKPSVPSAPPDPTADLALTGLIETTDGIRALVERISTREGEFVALGEQVFGFVLEEISPGQVTLTRGRDKYALKLGEKEIQPASGAAKADGGEEKPATPSPGASTPSGSGGPPGMPDFSNLSMEQRRDAYRRWWEGMSDDQRNLFRGRRGGFGGSGGGPRGGPGGSRGGRGPRG